jgi:predicted component of viral defense system (DUF524 family)
MPGSVRAALVAAEHPPAGCPALAFEHDPDGFFEDLRLRENAEYLLTVVVPHHLEDVRRRWELNGPGEFWPFDSARLAGAVRMMPPRYWTSSANGPGPRSNLLATANFASFVGVVDLSFEGRVIRAEVASSKISYFDDFKILLDEVSEDLVELLFEVDTVSGYRFSVGEPAEAAASTAVFHLRRVMREEELPSAVEAIIHHPYTRLVQEDLLTSPALARSLLPDRLAASVAAMPFERGGPLSAKFRGHTPSAVLETVRRDTVDTPENRYTKAVLQDMLVLLDRLEPVLVKEGKRPSAREVRRWRDRLDELLVEPIWRDVGQLTHIPFNSQVLLRRDAYRQVAQADLLIQYGLVLPWDRAQELAEETGDIRPIYELYEYWCFFCLRRILRRMCGPEASRAGDFYSVKEGRLEVTLRRGKASRLDFSVTVGAVPVSVALFFNRSFRKPDDSLDFLDASYSTSFRPDLSVLAVGGGTRHWLHFDAKYRLDVVQWAEEVTGSGVEDVEEDLIGPPEDSELYKKADLYKMHAYRDAILGSRGAYVLFPAQNAKPQLFRRHRSSKYRIAHDLPSVGAFPLRPGTRGSQEREIEDFLAAVLKSFSAGQQYREELGFPTTTT